MISFTNDMNFNHTELHSLIPWPLILFALEEKKWEKVTCEGYGTILSTTSQLFTDVFGLSLGIRPTDAGYVLHSHADPAGK